MTKRDWILAAVVLAGCSSSEAPSGAPLPESRASAKATATSSVSASPGAPAATPPSALAAASIAPPDPGPPACTRSNEKQWGTGANKLTGLTTKSFSGTLGVGFALGTDPRVLVMDKKGGAKVLKVKMGSKVTPPKDGRRSLLRVSPVAIEGETARAFLDFRDEYKDKRRRVVCGPAESDEDFLSYEGTSWLDMDPKPVGEEKKKLFSWKKLGGYVELRDCRTFVTRKNNEVWALGSVLRGTEKPDGTNEWKVVFLVDFGKGDDEIVLHESPLKDDPPKLLTYEIPTSRRMGDKGFVVGTRFGGSLMVGVLDTAHKLKGSFKTYRGYPSMPDIGRSEDELTLLTGVGTGKEKLLKALLIPTDTLELPASYTDVPLAAMDKSEDAEAAFTAPELTIDTKGQRWLAYVEGPRDKGHLRIVPLGKDLKPLGRPFSVTEGDVFASEARLAALDDGRLMIAYLREKDKAVELVTEELSCEVKK